MFHGGGLGAAPTRTHDCKLWHARDPRDEVAEAAGALWSICNAPARAGVVSDEDARSDANGDARCS